MRLHRSLLAALLTGGCLVSMPALAEDPLGLYLGASVGDAQVRADRSIAGTVYDVSRSDTGWKAMVGVRPISILGAEFEYADFGDPHYSQHIYAPIAVGTIHSRAEALYGMAYLPLPVPFLDVFAKAGAAHLRTTVEGVEQGLLCPIPAVAPGCPFISSHPSSTSFAFGAGVQLKFSALAVRAEYERIDASFGAPDMVSLGVTWTF